MQFVLSGVKIVVVVDAVIIILIIIDQVQLLGWSGKISSHDHVRSDFIMMSIILMMMITSIIVVFFLVHVELGNTKKRVMSSLL